MTTLVGTVLVGSTVLAVGIVLVGGTAHDTGITSGTLI